jgi:hypothetical protein
MSGEIRQVRFEETDNFRQFLGIEIIPVIRINRVEGRKLFLRLYDEKREASMNDL